MVFMRSRRTGATGGMRPPPLLDLVRMVPVFGFSLSAATVSGPRLSCLIEVGGSRARTLKSPVVKSVKTFGALCQLSRHTFWKYDDEKVSAMLDGKQIVKTIVVPDKLVNFVV